MRNVSWFNCHSTQNCVLSTASWRSSIYPWHIHSNISCRFVAKIEVRTQKKFTGRIYQAWIIQNENLLRHPTKNQHTLQRFSPAKIFKVLLLFQKVCQLNSQLLLLFMDLLSCCPLSMEIRTINLHLMREMELGWKLTLTEPYLYTSKSQICIIICIYSKHAHTAKPRPALVTRWRRPNSFCTL